MYKKIALVICAVIIIASFTLAAKPDKDSASALFFQYSFDDDFRQIDSIGAYMRYSQFNGSQFGSSWGVTFELPIGYDNDRLSMKYSGFVGPSRRFKTDGVDNLLTIGPSVTGTLLIDTYYVATMVDMGIFIDMATSYPVSEIVEVIMGGSFIYDVARFSTLETASTSDSGFEKDFYQLSGKIYLGFSISK